MRSAAKAFNVSKSHLYRLILKAKASESTSFIYKANIGDKKVFSTNQDCFEIT